MLNIAFNVEVKKGLPWFSESETLMVDDGNPGALMMTLCSQAVSFFLSFFSYVLLLTNADATIVENYAPLQTFVIVGITPYYVNVFSGRSRKKTPYITAYFGPPELNVRLK